MANKRTKDIEYGLVGLGLGLLGYYILKPKSPSTTQNTKSVQNTMQNTNQNTNSTQNVTSTTGSSTSTNNSECNLITPNNFSQNLLVTCFGGTLTSCGLYQPLTSQNGFCEAFQTGLNASVTPPNIKSGLVFYNPTNGFFGFYWVNPGFYGGVSPCYCNGTKQVLPANSTGYFFNWIGLILPGYYTWLPTYYFPSGGVGFLTYQGAMWYSPVTYGLLDYIKNNDTVYTIKIPGTPDQLGYTVQTYTTSTSGSLCFNYPSLNSNFCVPIAYNQTIPFWASSNTTVQFCPSSSPTNCMTVYG